MDLLLHHATAVRIQLPVREVSKVKVFRVLVYSLLTVLQRALAEFALKSKVYHQPIRLPQAGGAKS